MRFATKEQLQDVVEYMGNNIHVPQLVQHFNRDSIYSTDERVVGCWIDGRPLYKKTVDLGALPNATHKAVNHGISNLKMVAAYDGAYIAPNSSLYGPLPNVSNPNSSNNWSIDIQVNETQIIMNCKVDASFVNGYVTLFYTKTTDAENSFNLADENDYSTTEHIVGTWIDGKPVYQKTVNMGTLPSNSEKQIAHGISNLNLVINTKVACINTNNGVNYVIPYPSPKNSSTDWTCMINQINSTNISIKTVADWGSTNNVWVTLQYTKTTD